MIKRLFACGLCFLMVLACSFVTPVAPATPVVPTVPTNPATSTAPPPLLVEEHLLSGQPDISTDQLVFHFAQGDQNAILARTAGLKDYFSQWKDYNIRALEPFGYQLKFKPQPGAGSYETLDIYKGDQIIARDAVLMHPVSVSASGNQFMGVVEMPTGAYTFAPGRFEARPAPFEKQPYGYVGDKLLSLEITSVSSGRAKINVYLDDQPVYSTEFNDVSVYGPFEGPWTYGNHWALVVIDSKSDDQQGWTPVARLIQDGQDVQAIKGYQQAFQFALLDGKPFYFYQMADKIGISFDGVELAKGYDEIPHYQCCSGSLLNPDSSMNMVWFLARRGNDWYYVEAHSPGSLP